MDKIQFSEKLKTDRFVLTPLLPSDVNEIFLLRSDPVVLKYLGRDPMKTMKEAEEYIKTSNEDFNNGKAADYAIRKEENGKMLGKIGLWQINKQRNRAELGYSLLPENHRQGIMFECAQRIIDDAFQELKFHSLCAEIDPLNDASRLLLEKCKFRKEAHFTEDYLYKGIYSDSAIYSLLAKWRG